jgi:hypothetical protein
MVPRSIQLLLNGQRQRGTVRKRENGKQFARRISELRHIHERAVFDRRRSVVEQPGNRERN